jgi:hypothetical protein
MLAQADANANEPRAGAKASARPGSLLLRDIFIPSHAGAHRPRGSGGLAGAGSVGTLPKHGEPRWAADQEAQLGDLARRLHATPRWAAVKWAGFL